jgi:hypothetical protein
MVMTSSSCWVPTTVFMYSTWQLRLFTSTEKKLELVKFSEL